MLKRFHNYWVNYLHQNVGYDSFALSNSKENVALIVLLGRVDARSAVMAISKVINLH